jgi:hypothetical protein
MPDPKHSLQKAVEAQKKMREAAEQAKRELDAERVRKEQQAKP